MCSDIRIQMKYFSNISNHDRLITHDFHNDCHFHKLWSVMCDNVITCTEIESIFKVFDLLVIFAFFTFMHIYIFSIFILIFWVDLKFT